MLNDRAELVSAIYLHWAAKRQRLVGIEWTKGKEKMAK